jgi:microcystin-dependent protein
MDEPYIGSIVLFAGPFEIMNWAYCDGRLLPIASYSALFAVIGTTFGGNGTSNFALPDLRGRVPIQQGVGPGLSQYNLGQPGGGERVTLTTNNLPPHSHPVNALSSAAGRGTSPASGLLSTPANAVEIYNTGTPNTQMSPAMIGNTGTSLPVSVMQPYLPLNYLIALNGLFPSRG